MTLEGKNRTLGRKGVKNGSKSTDIFYGRSILFPSYLLNHQYNKKNGKSYLAVSGW